MKLDLRNTAGFVSADSTGFSQVADFRDRLFRFRDKVLVIRDKVFKFRDRLFKFGDKLFKFRDRLQICGRKLRMSAK